MFWEITLSIYFNDVLEKNVKYVENKTDKDHELLKNNFSWKPMKTSGKIMFKIQFLRNPGQRSIEGKCKREVDIRVQREN